MQTENRPGINFNMFAVGRESTRLVAAEVQRFFGSENYDEFKNLGKVEKYVPSESRERVNRKVYDQVGGMFHIGGDPVEQEKFWKRAILAANSTIDRARSILFADQEKQATMTTNIAWSDLEPASILQRLTMPKRLIGEQCRYEQSLQLGIGLLCAEVMSRDENGTARKILSGINDFLEEELFVGKKGDPKRHYVFSYHTPETNRLQGISLKDRDPRFKDGLWVKSLAYPVRMLGLKDYEGNVVRVVPVLYDPREKEIESAVIKAKQRSWKAAEGQPNGGPIETSPYAEDQLGCRLVVMEGGRTLRDSIARQLEGIFLMHADIIRITKRDEVKRVNGDPNRVEFRRRYITIRGLAQPFEVQVSSVEDYIRQEYEVGDYDEELGMHDGPAHDLYKLKIVTDIAEYFWPNPIYGIDLKNAKKITSYEYAARLGRKQRISPSPY